MYGEPSEPTDGGRNLTYSFSGRCLPLSSQILESVVCFKWGALPMEQREGIKTYLSNLIIKYSTDEALFRGQRRFLGKLNMVLVQILKQARCAKQNDKLRADTCVLPLWMYDRVYPLHLTSLRCTYSIHPEAS